MEGSGEAAPWVPQLTSQGTADRDVPVMLSVLPFSRPHMCRNTESGATRASDLAGPSKDAWGN